MSDAERAVGTFWVFNLDWPLPLDLEPKGSGTFARLNVESAPTLAQAMGLADAAEVFRRLAGERRCYAIWSASALSAYGWVSFREAHIGELGLQLQLEPGEAYIWDCATLPAFRRRHYYTALLIHILQELRAEGLCRVWIGADADNTISMRAFARTGFMWVSELCIDQSGAKYLRGRPGVADILVDTTRRILLHESV
jgi:ribosomal protein S18 acetylase RimI-like enzyme